MAILGPTISDESLDRLRVYTLDGSNIAAGKSVRIEASVWSWTASGADNLDLYYTSDANARRVGRS
jgi:hypothetical protein